MRPKIVCLICFCVLFAAPLVRADTILLFDQSPITTGGTITPASPWSWENRADTQNFAERVVFSYDVRITGMSIYTYSYFAGGVGRDVAIKTWGENGMALDPTTLSRFDTVLSAVDTDGIGTYDSRTAAGYGVQARADFGTNSFFLAANTPLWIGMSGIYISYPSAPYNLGLFGLTGVDAPADGRMWQFGGDTSRGLAASSVGDMAMRLYGERVETPEPSSLHLVGIGLGVIGLAAWLRRKRNFGASC